MGPPDEALLRPVAEGCAAEDQAPNRAPRQLAVRAALRPDGLGENLVELPPAVFVPARAAARSSSRKRAPSSMPQLSRVVEESRSSWGSAGSGPPSFRERLERANNVFSSSGGRRRRSQYQSGRSWNIGA